MIPAPFSFIIWNMRDKKRFRQVIELAQEAFLRFGEYREFIGRLMVREDVYTGLLIDTSVKEDDVAGFVQVGLIPDEQGCPHGNILAIALAPAYRYKKLGPVLLEWAIESIQKVHQSTPVKEIQLTVAPDNEPAVRLFTRYGFGFIPEDDTHYYASGVQACEMSRPVHLD